MGRQETKVILDKHLKVPTQIIYLSDFAEHNKSKYNKIYKRYLTESPKDVSKIRFVEYWKEVLQLYHWGYLTENVVVELKKSHPEDTFLQQLPMDNCKQSVKVLRDTFYVYYHSRIKQYYTDLDIQKPEQADTYMSILYRYGEHSYRDKLVELVQTRNELNTTNYTTTEQKAVKTEPETNKVQEVVKIPVDYTEKDIDIIDLYISAEENKDKLERFGNSSNKDSVIKTRTRNVLIQLQAKQYTALSNILNGVNVEGNLTEYIKVNDKIKSKLKIFLKSSTNKQL